MFLCLKQSLWDPIAMHLNHSKQSLFWIIAISAFIGFVIFLNILDSGSYKVDPKSAKVLDKVEFENQVSLYVQLKEFDSASQTLKAKVWVVPPAKFATNLSSSVQVNYDTSIDISASSINYNDENNLGFWKANQYLRAIDIELDADNFQIDSRKNDKWFPFDRYSVRITGSIEFRTQGSETEDVSDDVWESIPIGVQSYTANLSGWNAVFKMSSFDNETVESSFLEGKFFISDIFLERTPLNKALLFLLGLIFLGGGFSMLILFRSILMSHRPPTLSGLIWAGSTAFTMIQTRTIIPGAPRVGVMFDLFIFYPSLVTCFISGGLMFYQWITKETWSREL